jgi:hypothetical protein
MARWRIGGVVMGGRRLTGVIVAVVGVLLFAGSFVWRSVAVPALVRFPTDLDVSPKYEGTVTLFIDPQTNLPLDQPREYPLTVDRHIKANSKESSTDFVVLDESLDLLASGLFHLTQQNRYVMDRRQIYNVDDPRAYAFAPDNKVNRAADYRLNFPFDTKETSYPIYKNEIGTAYRVSPASPPTGTAAGLKTLNFAANEPSKPVTQAYLAFLDQAVKLPRQLTLDQLKPILKSAGFDIDVMLPKLLPQLSAADVQTIVGLAQQPIDLAYQLSFTGMDAVEPYTGSIVDVPAVDELLTGVPTGTSVSTLQSLLQKYPNSPEAKAGLDAIAKLNAAPIKVFENKYKQTDASVTDIAKTVRDQRDKRRLAESTIPNAMLIVGIVLTVIGVLLAILWGRRRRRAPEPDTAAEAAESSDVAAADPDSRPPDG